MLLSFEARVDSHSLCGGGNGDGKEDPLWVEVYFFDVDGKERVFWTGFYSGEGCLTQLSDHVMPGVWTRFGVALHDRGPRPARLVAITIGANAKIDFASAVRGVPLEVAPE